MTEQTELQEFLKQSEAAYAVAEHKHDIEEWSWK